METVQQAAQHSRGAHAPSHVVSGALAGNSVDARVTPVFGEGAKDNTRGRVFSPRQLRLSLSTKAQIMTRGSISIPRTQKESRCGAMKGWRFRAW